MERVVIAWMSKQDSGSIQVLSRDDEVVVYLQDRYDRVLDEYNQGRVPSFEGFVDAMNYMALCPGKHCQISLKTALANGLIKHGDVGPCVTLDTNMITEWSKRKIRGFD
jgi:hypothetical protein